MIWSLLTTTVLAAVGSTVATATTATSPFGCVAFDVSWNLLAFGFNGKDYNAGTQDAWASGSPTDITTTGRPPFNAANTTCYLSQLDVPVIPAQYTNAIYVLNADSANPANIFIYDATAKSWSTQQVVAGTFDPSNFATILDHDTNVFYSYSGSNIFSLDMGLLKSANATALSWVDVQSPDLTASPQAGAAAVPGANTAGYQPVIALAQNHIHFLGVSGLPSGSAKIFVIHFSYMQPTPQSYGTFPTTHGKTASFFMDSGVQQEFAFVPDDGSATYVVNVETNTTKTLTGPPQQDPFATYYASTNSLVQLTSSGKVAFLAYNPNTTTSGGTWTTISKLPVASFGATSSGLNTSTGSPLGSSNTGANGTSTGSSSTGSSKYNSAALRIGLTSSAGIWSLLTVGLAVTLCGAFL